MCGPKRADRDEIDWAMDVSGGDKAKYDLTHLTFSVEDETNGAMSIRREDVVGRRVRQVKRA